MVRNAMSATEFYILQYLWTRETPATFSEIMVHFNEEEKKAWKKQTVNTFLSRLAQKGFLNIDKSGKRAIYIPSVTSKKFYENYAQEIVKDSYNGAIKDFIAAFTAGNKLSAAEKAELLSYFERACAERGGQTPHILEEAFSWHTRLKQTGSMKKEELLVLAD